MWQHRVGSTLVAACPATEANGLAQTHAALTCDAAHSNPHSPPVPRGVQALEQLVQQHHLAGGDHQARGHVVVPARPQPVLLLSG